ncbi:hypothetical protein KESI111651_15170 [Kerstersia similis]
MIINAAQAPLGTATLSVHVPAAACLTPNDNPP